MQTQIKPLSEILKVSLQKINATQGFLISKKLNARAQEQESKIFWAKKPINFGDIYSLYFFEINKYFGNEKAIGYQLTNPSYTKVKNGKKSSYKCYQSHNFAYFPNKIRAFHFFNLNSENSEIFINSEKYMISENSLLFVPMVDNKFEMSYDKGTYEMVSFDLIF